MNQRPTGPEMTMGDPALGRKLIALALILGVIAVCYKLVAVFAYGYVTGFILLAVSCLVLIWTFTARDYWWVMLPVTVAFGGFFYFGFKIYLHELGLLLCFLPLVVTVAAGARADSGRPPVPKSIYLLVGYLCLHFLLSETLAKSDNLPGIGRILRVYMRGLWPLLFLVAFLRFGKSTPLRAAFIAMYLTALARIILGLASYFFPSFMYVPGINLILPATAFGFSDLRSASLMFAAMNLCYAAMSTSAMRKGFHLVLVAAAGSLTLLGGGRSALLMFCATLLIMAVLRRRTFVTYGLAVALTVLVILLNRDPQVLYSLPDPVRRALTVLVIESRHTDVHGEIQGSNEWHRELNRLGLRNWLRSPITFAFGNRIYPFSEDFFSYYANLQSRLVIAAQTGSYEAGAWTVLAVTGLMGGALYALVFRRLLKGLAGDLRRDGIRDYAQAFSFMAVSSGALWLGFCFFSGHFPSEALLYAGIAYGARLDAHRDKESGRAELPQPVSERLSPANA